MKKCNSVAGGDGSDGVAGDSVHLRAEAADKLFREELLLRVEPSRAISPSSAADETDIAGGGGDTKMEEVQTPNADVSNAWRRKCRGVTNISSNTVRLSCEATVDVNTGGAKNTCEVVPMESFATPFGFIHELPPQPSRL